MLVTGLSGAGKSSILRVLEDLGYETVDNPPLSVLGALLTEPGTAPSALGPSTTGPSAPGPPTVSPLAVGVDVRSRGFDAGALMAGLEALRARPELSLTLVFATAEEEALQRRFSETRRRHPLAPLLPTAGGPGGLAEGIARERRLILPLRAVADWVVDTTGLPLPELRRLVERRFRRDPEAGGAPPMAVAVRSFAYPAGLPRDADLVFDMRFLRNPHYDPILQPLTGQDPPVAAYVEADPEFTPFWDHMTALLDPLLPRYVAEGKKYLTIAFGCTGGQHRSVVTAERLAAHLERLGWRVDLSHRELRAAAGGVSARHPAAGLAASA